MVSIPHHSLQRQGGGQDGWGEHPSCGALKGSNKKWTLSPSFCLAQSSGAPVQATTASSKRSMSAIILQNNIRSRTGRQHVCF